MDDIFEALVCCIPVFCIAGIIVVFGMVGLTLYAEHRQTAVVEVSGKEVFRGSALCVSVTSAGASTHVSIGLPCEFPGRHYVGNDVKIVSK